MDSNSLVMVLVCNVVILFGCLVWSWVAANFYSFYAMDFVDGRMEVAAENIRKGQFELVTDSRGVVRMVRIAE